MTRLQAGCFGGLIPGRGKRFFAFVKHADSGAHLALYSMDTGDCP